MTPHRSISLWFWLGLLGGFAGAAAADRVRAADPGRLLALGRAALDRAVLPGPLHPLHAAEPDAASCAACHELTHQVPDARCLACHQEVQSAGRVHAGFQGACRDCHADHRATLIELDRTAFNHARARFPLRGAHAETRCEACHEQPARRGTGTRMRWQDLPHATCDACHRDPHGATLAPAACTACHQERAWSGDALRFDHARAFALDPTHAPLACASCHAAAPVFPALPRDCAGCHAVESAALAGRLPGGVTGPADAHAGLVGCADCHAPGDGPAPAPSLLAARCASCHTPHHAALLLERLRRADEVAAACRRLILLRPAAERAPLEARLAALRAQTPHDHPVGLRALEALRDELSHP